MLTGRRPFEGRDVSEVLAGVIRAEPQWDVLADTPPHLNMLLKRCLEKDQGNVFKPLATCGWR